MIKLLPLSVALLAGGCVSLEQAAPPAVMLGAQSGHGNLAVLEKGREIYVTSCAKCHTVEPVNKYSSERWDKILPEMTVKSKLRPADADAVRMYVRAVLNH